MHWPEFRELSLGRNSIFNAVLWLLIELLPSVQFLSKNSGAPPCLESSQDESMGEAVLPPLSRRLHGGGLRSAGSDPGFRRSQLRNSDVSEPQFPYLKTGRNKTYFSGLLQGLVEGLLVKLSVGELVYRKCSVNGGRNCVVTHTQLLSNGAGCGPGSVLRCPTLPSPVSPRYTPARAELQCPRSSWQQRARRP